METRARASMQWQLVDMTPSSYLANWKQEKPNLNVYHLNIIECLWEWAAYNNKLCLLPRIDISISQAVTTV